MTPARLLPLLAPLLVLLAPRPAGAHPEGAEAVRVGPPPAWVAPLAVEPGARGKEGEASGGVEYLLVDGQTRVGPRGRVERYRHWASRVVSEAGTAEASDVRVGFAPAFQRLTVHGVWLTRGGERRSVLKPGQLQVIQQEQGLEEQLYDGRLTALYFVPDVRVGDVVEVAFTVTGDNPVFQGRFSDAVEVQYRMPVVRWRQRLLWPAARTLHVENHRTELAPFERVLERGGVREYVWEQRDVAALDPDDRLPAGLDPWPWVQLSEYPDWASVVAWALPLYAAADAHEPAVVREAARLAREAGPSPEVRLLAALRFVQDEVRYLGIERGAASHRPHAPTEVLARRFGDCKDKSLLLVALLRELGLAADPALVSVDARGEVAGWHPTPTAFDHVVVRARVGERAYWVDPTRSLERGPLAQLAPPPVGRALVLRAGERALTEVPPQAAPEPLTDVEEVWREERDGGPATLTVTTVLRGREADGMRARLATTARADLARDYLNYYARTDAKLAAAGPLEVRDAPEANTLTLVERYRLEDGFWTDGARALRGSSVQDALVRPRITRRTLPLGLAHPAHVRHRLTLVPARALAITPAGGEVKGPGFTVTWSARPEGGGVALDYRYVSEADTVALADVERHLAALDEAEDALGYTVRRAGAAAGAGTDGAERAGSDAAWGLGLLLGVGTLLAGAFAAGWWVGRAWGPGGGGLPAPGPVAPGASATQPLLVAAAELDAHLGAHACPCGHAGPHHPHVEARPVYGRLVTRYSWTCPGCGRAHRLYLALAEAAAPPPPPEAPTRAA